MGIRDLKPVAPTKIDAIFLDEEVPQDYKDHLLLALIHPLFSSANIQRELEEDGYKVGATAIKDYRSKLSRLVLANLENSHE